MVESSAATVRRNSFPGGGGGYCSFHQLLRFDRLAFPQPDTALLNENPVSASGCWGLIYFGQRFREIVDNFFVLRFGRNVGPFVGISLHIIQFLGAIRVSNVTPTIGANRVVADIVRGDRRPASLGFGVFQLRQKTVAFDAGFFGQSAEFNQC